MEHLYHPSIQFHWCQNGALFLLRRCFGARGLIVTFYSAQNCRSWKGYLYINHLPHHDLTHWMVTIFIFDCMTVQTSNTILVWQMSKAKWTIRLLVWLTSPQGEGAPIWKGGRCSLEILKEISLRGTKIWSLGVAWFFFLDLHPWAGQPGHPTFPYWCPPLGAFVTNEVFFWGILVCYLTLGK